MNWNQVEGRWQELKGKAQSKWGELTEDDLDRIQGNREELIGKIKQAYGKTQEEAEEEVDDWLNRH